MHDQRHNADEIARATAGNRHALVNDAGIAAGVEAARRTMRNPDSDLRDLVRHLDTTQWVDDLIGRIGYAPDAPAAAADTAADAQQLATSRAALARARALRRADARLITDADADTNEFASAARIDALADDLSAATRAELGAVHVSAAARMQHAGRAAATPTSRWPTESCLLT